MSQQSDAWSVRTQSEWFYCRKYKIRVSGCVKLPCERCLRQRSDGQTLLIPMP